MRRKLLIIRQVVGSSMEPTLRAGQLVLASGFMKCRTGDVVVLAHDNLEKIKRIEQLADGQVFVLGDNPDASTDSRTFGWLPESSVIARVVWPHSASKSKQKFTLQM